MLVAAGCVSLDGAAGTASPVDAGVAASALAIEPVLVGAGSEGVPPASCELATGCSVAAGCAAVLEATGGFLAVVFAAIAGFDPVLLLLGSAGDDEGEELGSDPEHAASACNAAAVESA